MPVAAIAATWDFDRYADGVGTSYYLLIDKTGTDSWGFTPYKALDTSGCSDGQNGGGGGGFETSSGTKIARARTVLCWTNDGIDCWQVAEPGVWKDNPAYP
ncbi:hypothetical protein [Nocardioides stalactiti]|uniref:hypothetical protein n=1 Tax=Nocardioides stalactiti TaxID=2755356 RepID=UPI001600AECB|nr:hypothetical protein [Nocardioides stalactiti]